MFVVVCEKCLVDDFVVVFWKEELRVLMRGRGWRGRTNILNALERTVEAAWAELV